MIGIGLLLLTLMIAYYLICFYIARQAENKLNEGQKLYQPKKTDDPPQKTISSLSSYMKPDEKQSPESNKQNESSKSMNSHQDDDYQNWQMDDDESEKMNSDPKLKEQEPKPDEFENWEMDDVDE